MADVEQQQQKKAGNNLSPELFFLRVPQITAEATISKFPNHHMTTEAETL